MRLAAETSGWTIRPVGDLLAGTLAVRCGIGTVGVSAHGRRLRFHGPLQLLPQAGALAKMKCLSHRSSLHVLEASLSGVIRCRNVPELSLQPLDAHKQFACIPGRKLLWPAPRDLIQVL